MGNPFNPLNHPIVFSTPRRLTQFSFWVEHIPFGMLLVDLLKPDMILELGTHYGDSYCALCQAVQTLNLKTQCYAVDTWQGDRHVGPYGPEVLADLSAHHDPLYSGFSRLIRSTFDQALTYFLDGTIDLLHIDGTHTYEAVRHDFDAWLPKASPRGVVLFHDTNMRERDFGVWKLWEEVKVRHPHMEFFHGYGLGVLAVGARQPPAFEALLAAWRDGDCAAVLQNFFFQLGQKIRWSVQARQAHQRLVQLQADEQQARAAVQSQLQAEQERSTEAMAQKDRALESLQLDLSERNWRLDAAQAELHAAQRRFADALAEKECALEALRLQLAERDQEVRALQGELRTEQQRFAEGMADKERSLQALQLQLAEHRQELERLRDDYPGIVEQLAIKQGAGVEDLSAMLDQKSALVERPLQDKEAVINYLNLVRRIQADVNHLLPLDARVVVVSKGDEELLHLGARMAWHFPLGEGGVYAGHNPAESSEAIMSLEALRKEGAQFFLLPVTAFWWLEHYVEFKRYLETSSHTIWANEDCIIYALLRSEPVAVHAESSCRAHCLVAHQLDPS